MRRCSPRRRPTSSAMPRHGGGGDAQESCSNWPSPKLRGTLSLGCSVCTRTLCNHTPRDRAQCDLLSHQCTKRSDCGTPAHRAVQKYRVITPPRSRSLAAMVMPQQTHDTDSDRHPEHRGHPHLTSLAQILTARSTKILVVPCRAVVPEHAAPPTNRAVIFDRDLCTDDRFDEIASSDGLTRQGTQPGHRWKSTGLRLRQAETARSRRSLHVCGYCEAE